MKRIKGFLTTDTKISPPNIKSTDSFYIEKEGAGFILHTSHIYTESFSLFSIIMVEFSCLFLIVRRGLSWEKKPQCSKFISGVNPEQRLSQSFTPR